MVRFSLLRATTINLGLLVSVLLMCSSELFLVSDDAKQRVFNRVDIQNILETDFIWQLAFFVAMLMLLYGLFILVVTASFFYWINRCGLTIREKYLLSGFCFVVVSHWLVLLNQLYFPFSVFFSLFFVAADSIFYQLYVSVFGVTLVLFIIYSGYRWFNTLYPISPIVFMGMLLGLLLIPVFNQYSVISLINQSRDANAQRPNLVLIGIDSLRYNLIDYDGNRVSSEYAPNIAKFIEQSASFVNTYTPLARTHVALSSLYTGMYPYNHGIRYNLTPEKYTNKQAKWLPSVLREEGYRTYFGLDDRRFASIDKKEGFDKVVGPKRGASDYILGMVNDNPIANLITLFSVSKYIFPYSYSNRGVAKRYHPDFFVNELLEVTNSSQEENSFVSVHFTLPHWPYYWSHSRPVDTSGELPSSYLRYLSSMRKMDDVFQNYLERLQSQGILNNALVVLYSDHGEGWNTTDKQSIIGSVEYDYGLPTLKGHGTNVISEQQVRTVLAFKRFGDENYASGVRYQIASLVDVFPTIIDLLDLSSEQSLDGISLTPWILDQRKQPSSRYVFTESGLHLKGLDDVDNNLNELLVEGLKAYQFKKNGEYYLKGSVINQLLKSKQYAIYSDEGVLAYFPVNGKIRYVQKRRNKSGITILDEDAIHTNRLVSLLNQYIDKANKPLDL